MVVRAREGRYNKARESLGVANESVGLGVTHLERSHSRVCGVSVCRVGCLGRDTRSVKVSLSRSQSRLRVLARVVVVVVCRIEIDSSRSSGSSVLVVVESVELVLNDQGLVELVSDSLARRPQVESEGCEVNVVKERDEPWIFEKNENASD